MTTYLPSLAAHFNLSLFIVLDGGSPFMDQCAVASWSKEGWDACTSSTDSLSQRPLWQ